MYNIEIKEQVVKHLLKFPTKIFKQVVTKILFLQENPRPQDCKTLKGIEGAHRVDQGEYRILYTINDKERLVRIFKVAHRSEVYREF